MYVINVCNMDEKTAKKILNTTHQNYSLIAKAFSSKRMYLWSGIKNLKRFFSDGDKILDIGCGNGRLLELFDGVKIDYVGIDNCFELIEEAKQIYQKKKNGLKTQTYRFVVANALSLPFRDNFFDKMLSIAVFHHIPSKKLRIKFLKQANRTLKPNGLLIISVWNLYQKRFFKYHIKYFLLKIIHKSKLDFKDIFYPWKNEHGKIIAQRYLHCFSLNSLAKLAKQTGFNIKEKGYLSDKKQNLYLVLEKQVNKPL